MAIWWAAVPFALLGLIQVNSFYVTGSLHPDPSTGRVTPFTMHGTLYVTPQQADLATGALGVGVALVVLGLFVPLLARLGRGK